MSGSKHEENPVPEIGADALTPTMENPPAPAVPDPWDIAKERAPLLEHNRKQHTLGPGSMLVGRYTVLDVLGAGGMGVVLAAYDVRLDRRVALKLLRSSDGRNTPSKEARLVREAQAMARLNHPNVVGVYDAGTLDDGEVFVAMEYVEGQTLRHWRQQKRSWQEVLGVYLAAGRGLAAAHAANIIHRDFKPDNVLIGKDGRVRVTDFGLARAEDPLAIPMELAPTPSQELPLPSAPLNSRLTLPGVVMGTPAYMAPEVLRGKPANTRSDIYSFCVSLYEALYGQMPYSGKTLAEFLQNQSEGRVRPAPESTQIPDWVRRAVLQGLESDPFRRYSSLEELLGELARDPGAKRWTLLRAGALGTGIGGLIVLTALAWMREERHGCSHQERRLAGVWDTSVKTRLKQALESTGASYAPDTFGRVSMVLDAYAGMWAKQREEVCEALRGQAAEPRSLAAKREYCLERRRSQMRALTGLLAQGPDKEILSKAVQAAQSLPSLEYCADAQALAAAVPPPEDSAVRAKVETLQKHLDHIEALHLAGKSREGLKLCEELLHQAELVDYTPMLAQVLYMVAKLREATGDYKGAEEGARRAIILAARSKALPLLAQAWSHLVTLVGARQGRIQEAAHLELGVDAAVELAEDDRARAAALNSLGNMLRRAGRPDEAIEKYKRALSLREKALGLEHPDVAASLSNLGNTLSDLGRYAEAREKCEQALAMDEKMLGPEHPYVAASLTCLGNALVELGRYEEAKEKYERTLVLNERTLSPGHPYIAATLHNLGNALAGIEKYEEAKEKYERALSIREKALGLEHPDVASTLEGLGRVLTELGSYKEAQDRYERALLLREKTQGGQHPDLSIAYLGLGALQRLGGQSAKAIPLLERASSHGLKRLRADTQFELARALWDANQNRHRAVQLATQARTDWERINHSTKLARASQWLVSHSHP